MERKKIDYGFKNHLPPQPRQGKVVPEDSIVPSDICKYLRFCSSTISNRLNMLYDREKPEGLEHSYRPAALTNPRSVRLEGAVTDLNVLSGIPASDIYNIGKKSE